ncbi:MAG: hypothetical protein DHS80DRAFT_21239 [Piptocephalis tieghemiana]|nr:MAG: hypothetical protein DHS80DRAFT_21239 [Piptocephalis tieghemiana]
MATSPSSEKALERLDLLFSTPAIPLHIFLMTVSYGLLLPVGILLGQRRHPLHIPVQLVFFACAILGALAGYAHPHGHHPHPHPHSPSLHVALAPWILAASTLQALGGGWRKWVKTVGWEPPSYSPSKEEGYRSWGWWILDLPRYLHRWLGRLHLVLAYGQCVTGVMKLLKPGQGLDALWATEAVGWHWSGTGMILFGLALLARPLFSLALPPAWFALSLLAPCLLLGSLLGSYPLLLPLTLVGISLVDLVWEGKKRESLGDSSPLLLLLLSIPLLGHGRVAPEEATGAASQSSLILRVMAGLLLLGASGLTCGNQWLWRPWGEVVRRCQILISGLVLLAGLLSIHGVIGYTQLATRTDGMSEVGYVLLSLFLSLLLTILLLYGGVYASGESSTMGIASMGMVHRHPVPSHAVEESQSDRRLWEAREERDEED